MRLLDGRGWQVSDAGECSLQGGVWCEWDVTGGDGSRESKKDSSGKEVKSGNEKTEGVGAGAKEGRACADVGWGAKALKGAPLTPEETSMGAVPL